MQFDFRPTLSSDLLTLRPLLDGDFEALYAVANDPLMWEQHPDRQRHREPEFRKFFDSAIASDSALVAIDNETGEVIGTSRYHGLDTIRSEIEIGWTFLARSHWGGPFNREMKRLMLDHAYRFVETVLFIVGADNLRSQRAVQKIGATLVDDDYVRGGKRNVVYRLALEQYTRQQQVTR